MTCLSCENGSVTVFGDKTRFAEGDTVTLTVKPDDGYMLSTMTVKQGETEVPATDRKNGTYTFTMPAGEDCDLATSASILPRRTSPCPQPCGALRRAPLRA